MKKQKHKTKAKKEVFLSKKPAVVVLSKKKVSKPLAKPAKTIAAVKPAVIKPAAPKPVKKPIATKQKVSSRAQINPISRSKPTVAKFKRDLPEKEEDDSEVIDQNEEITPEKEKPSNNVIDQNKDEETDSPSRPKPEAYAEADYERNSVSIYMKQMAETPLLTPAEEIKLAKRIKRGDKNALDHLIKANLRLVVSIAGKYVQFGLPFPDLISEGNLGLVKAAAKFNPKFNAKFSTYACWWIKQYIRNAIEHQTRTIRIPVHAGAFLRKIQKIDDRYMEECGRAATNDELSFELKSSIKKIATIRDMGASIRSLDAPVSDFDSSSGSFAEFVSDESAIPADQAFLNADISSNTMAAINSLDLRSAEVIKHRFGLDNRQVLTLEELGRKYKVTRERIRQVEYYAIRELREILRKKEKGIPIMPQKAPRYSMHT